MNQSAEKSFKLLKKPTSAVEFFSWSYFLSLAPNLLLIWLETNSLTGGRDLWQLALLALIPAVVLFLYWMFIRWVATTAEKAGRSFVAFMIFAILAPAIAPIVVIMFKKPETTAT